MSPRTAAGKFYEALQKVDGWQTKSVAAAAQAVQRSAFPDAYADDEPRARQILANLDPEAALQLVSAATGGDCTTPAGGDTQCAPTQSPAEEGLTPDALLVLRCVNSTFGEHTYGGVGNRASNPGSDHPSGRAVDVMINDWSTPKGIAAGDAIAAWLTQHYRELGITYVIWRARIWNPGSGWRPYRHPSGATDPTSLHMDHVHASVKGNAGTGFALAASGRIVVPLPAGTYTDLHNYGRSGTHWSSTHTGTDLSSPCGTPVSAATDGTVEITHPAWAGRWLLTISTGTGQALDVLRAHERPQRPCRTASPCRTNSSVASVRRATPPAVTSTSRSGPTARTPSTRHPGSPSVPDDHPATHRRIHRDHLDQDHLGAGRRRHRLHARPSLLTRGHEAADAPATAPSPSSSETAGDNPSPAVSGAVGDPAHGEDPAALPSGVGASTWQATARSFAAAFTNTDGGKDAWRARLRTLVAPSLDEAYAETDLSLVPTATFLRILGGRSVPSEEPTYSTLAVYTGGLQTRSHSLPGPHHPPLGGRHRRTEGDLMTALRWMLRHWFLSLWLIVTLVGTAAIFAWAAADVLSHHAECATRHAATCPPGGQDQGPGR
ncbi:hypothetical protein G5V59_27340 [Nocardioides sp. W3-2-3]|uniref:hypothetical protein n=1 Tax=Nocardioides convexus TaxID=2712224 RepID=UPI002418B2D4|nr:hypothetical protein [Nocardioides convexus]NHA02097.1 hypothetical protein [Nocardioides convexus]